jgi:alcohol dehydrogenase (cytochrome c)/quinohemoprotein ethanol dehydrogenase
MAFSPDIGLMYIPTNYGSYPLVAEAGAKLGNQLLSINVAKCPRDPPPQLEGTGSYLLAFDPVAMKAVWKQPLGSSRSGVMATAGNLVFQGSAPSRSDLNPAPPRFSAFRADTGERLWTTDTQANIVGGAATYAVDGEQYVAVVAGVSGSGDYWAPNYARLLVFKLDGKAALPQPAPYTPRALNPPEETGDEAQLALGEAQYNSHCVSCHGNGERVSSVFPDLRYSGLLGSAEGFKAIVLGGALQANGMVSFSKLLKPEDADAIRAYVVHEANLARSAPRGAGSIGGGYGRCTPPPAAAPAPASAPGAGTPPALHP